MIVTVIVPTYNRAGLLKRAVTSLLRQSGDAELDILIVDDGSTDDTSEVIADLKEAALSVRSVYQPNGGVTSARNLGLQNLLPETEIVTFLDSDDISPPGRFANDLPHLRDDPSVDLTYGRLLRVDGIDEETLEPAEGSLQANVMVIQLSAGLFRRSLIDAIGLFDVEMEQGEDTDYLFRIFESGATFRQTSTMTLYYVRHSGNMTNDLAKSKRYFAKAVMRSTKRRKLDPNRTFNAPKFDSEAFMETGFF